MDKIYKALILFTDHPVQFSEIINATGRNHNYDIFLADNYIQTMRKNMEFGLRNIQNITCNCLIILVRCICELRFEINIINFIRFGP